MKIVSIINQKGGCGKTTTTVNLAAAFAEQGHRSLVVDLDPQAHSTLGLGIDPDSLTHTIYEAMTKPDVSIVQTVMATKIDRVDLVPCNVLLAGAEIELASVESKEIALATQLQKLSQRYGICVIDCPPSLGILTLNALVASTDVIVPVQVHYYALEGLKRLLETIRIVRERFEPCKCRLTGLVLTFVEDGTIFSREIQQKMRGLFGELVFETVIHKTIRLAEAPSAGESILTYAPDSRGAADYRSLAWEILNRRWFAAPESQNGKA